MNNLLMLFVVLIVMYLFCSNYYEAFISASDVATTPPPSISFFASCLPTFGYGGKGNQAVYSQSQCESLGGSGHAKFINDPLVGVCSVKGDAQKLPISTGYAMTKNTCESQFEGDFVSYSYPVGYCIPYSGNGSDNLCASIPN